MFKVRNHLTNWKHISSDYIVKPSKYSTDPAKPIKIINLQSCEIKSNDITL
jgi:hypothetical protein